MKTAILIPCYNESMTIKKVINDFQKALPDAEIYVYDNNSTDGTDEIAKKEVLENLENLNAYNKLLEIIQEQKGFSL